MNRGQFPCPMSDEQGVVIHTCNPSTEGTGDGRRIAENLRLAWATVRNPISKTKKD